MAVMLVWLLAHRVLEGEECLSTEGDYGYYLYHGVAALTEVPSLLLQWLCCCYYFVVVVVIGAHYHCHLVCSISGVVSTNDNE